MQPTGTAVRAEEEEEEARRSLEEAMNQRVADMEQELACSQVENVWMHGWMCGWMDGWMCCCRLSD